MTLALFSLANTMKEEAFLGLPEAVFLGDDFLVTVFLGLFLVAVLAIIYCGK
jgi:hypothetical protein